MAVRTKKMQKVVPTRVNDALPSVDQLDTRIGGASVTSDAGGPSMSPKLARMAEKIREDIAGLGSLLQKAWERKLQLGHHLADARAICKSEAGNWSEFLALLGLHERTAREAIQFFGMKEQIEDLRRHGGAALNVSYVRARLAKPRTKDEERKPAVRTTVVEDEPAQVGLLALPSPGDGGGTPGIACEFTSTGGLSPDGGHVGVQVTPAVASGANAAKESITIHTSEHITNEELIVEMCSCMAQLLEEEIGSLGSETPQATIAALEQAAREILECYQRLDKALQIWSMKGK